MSTLNERLRSAVEQIVENTYTDKNGKYNANGVRSGKQRTAPFHRAVGGAVVEVLNANDDGYSFQEEYPITDCYGKDFKIDVAILRHGEIHSLILIKAVNGDYNRNRNNYNNTMIGETLRVKAKRPDGSVSPYRDIPVLFLNFIPTIQADYDRHAPHKLLRYQFTRTVDINHVLESAAPLTNAIDIMFINHVNEEDASRCKSEKRLDSLRQDGLGCKYTNKKMYFDRFMELSGSERITITDAESDKLYKYLTTDVS